MRQAARIAINRTVAGVHFPIDSVVGAILGLELAEFIAELSMPDGKPPAKRLLHTAFDGRHFPGSADFCWTQIYEVKEDHLLPEKWLKIGKFKDMDPAIIPSKPLHWLWSKAVDEWKD